LKKGGKGLKYIRSSSSHEEKRILVSTPLYDILALESGKGGKDRRSRFSALTEVEEGREKKSGCGFAAVGEPRGKKKPIDRVSCSRVSAGNS